MSAPATPTPGEATGASRPLRRRGFGSVTLVIAYLAVALAPLALAQLQGLPQRPFLDELSSGLALTGFAMLLVEFVLSGRFKTVSGRMGIDLTMRFHQLIARTLTVFILIHPFLYTLPYADRRPWDSARTATLGLDAVSLVTGLAAWILLALLVITSIRRDQLPYRYETWRLCHGLGAVAIAIFGLHHALAAGRYSAQPELGAFWLAMVGLAVLTMLYVYILTPLWQLRSPYTVASVDKVALKTWAIVIEPSAGDAMAFEAGQFAWFTLGRTPFAIREHPFSMSSCPADRPRIGFTIKEVGDFTREIGRIPVGTTAYLDGPHGNLTLTGREGDGIAFIAGGVGVAPVMSILRQLRVDRDSRPMTLIYGNRCAEQILYQAELEAMKEDLALSVHHVLSEPPQGWTGPVGELDAGVLRDLLNMERRGRWLYFVCGPAPMIDSVEESLGDLGIPMRQIVSEKFSYD